jgi:hypothetical protein
VTPYTNDTYVVHFIAFDPDDLYNTNKIDRTGVRAGASCLLTYEQEDPNDPTGLGLYLDTKANTWIDQTLNNLYIDLCANFSLTQYTPGQIGAYRDYPYCQGLDSAHSSWADFMRPQLTNTTLLSYSDLTIAQGHGNGATVGGGPYLKDTFTPADLQGWLTPVGTDWRLRKAAIWACYSGSISKPKGVTGATPPDLNTIPSFFNACGIRLTQNKSYVRKNCGLFFGDLVPQLGFGGNFSIVTAQVAEEVDQTWVCGPNRYPGGCDPTYSFRWAVYQIVNEYVELNNAQPVIIGFPIPYSGIYDDELVTNNVTHVKNP